MEKPYQLRAMGPRRAARRRFLPERSPPPGSVPKTEVRAASMASAAWGLGVVAAIGREFAEMRAARAPAALRDNAVA
jgi:hypothetical protein